MVKNRSLEEIEIHRYPEEGYATYFNKSTGLFIRAEEPGRRLPFWASTGPELLDISITNWCDRECDCCYRGSSLDGVFMQVRDYQFVLEQASSLDTCQVALGGGNPNQHPDFIELLRITREQFGIVPNYTTNGRGLTDKVLESTREYCGAVAVSAYPPFSELSSAIQKLIAFSIKTNVHFVLDSISIDTAIRWLTDPPCFLEGVNALVFLNFKPIGRGSDAVPPLRYSNRVPEFFELLGNARYPFNIGFDSCSVSGLLRYSNVDRQSIDFCEAARFSAFVSEDLRFFPCSFMEGMVEGIDLRKKSMRDAWINGDLFTLFRTRLDLCGCPNCVHWIDCHGGCPIFPEANLCMSIDVGDALLAREKNVQSQE